MSDMTFLILFSFIFFTKNLGNISKLYYFLFSWSLDLWRMDYATDVIYQHYLYLHLLLCLYCISYIQTIEDYQRDTSFLSLVK